MITIRTVPSSEKDQALSKILALVEAERDRPGYLYLRDPDFYADFFSDRGMITAAWNDGALIGFLLLGFESTTIEFWHEYIDRMGADPDRCCYGRHALIAPGYRGIGIGRQMMIHRSNAARSLGYHLCFTTTHPHNVAIERVYKDSGFVRIDRRVVFDRQLLRSLWVCRLTQEPTLANATQIPPSSRSLRTSPDDLTVLNAALAPQMAADPQIMADSDLEDAHQ